MSGTQRVSLAGVFTVGDGDDLTVTASPSNEIVATVAVSADGASLTVTAKSRGTAQITGTGGNGEHEVSDTFRVTVKVSEGRIGDCRHQQPREGTSQDVTLSRVFSDADHDTLTLSASSSASTVATMSLATGGSSLTVTGVAEVAATITVAARDSDGKQVSDTFDVTVSAQPVVEASGSESEEEQDVIARYDANQDGVISLSKRTPCGRSV